jgi:hypothetical protein
MTHHYRLTLERSATLAHPGGGNTQRFPQRYGSCRLRGDGALYTHLTDGYIISINAKLVYRPGGFSHLRFHLGTTPLGSEGSD